MLACAAAASVLLGGWAARAQDAGRAEAFIRQLYARYTTKQEFSPFADVLTVRAIATPGLAQLVHRDQVLSTAAHDEGGLDADPVCGCQDPGGMRLDSVAVAPGAAGQATATAILQFGSDRVTRRFLLQAVGGEWRIDDITDGTGQNGVRAALNQSITGFQRRHKR